MKMDQLAIVPLSVTEFLIYCRVAATFEKTGRQAGEFLHLGLLACVLTAQHFPNSFEVQYMPQTVVSLLLEILVLIHVLWICYQCKLSCVGPLWYYLATASLCLQNTSVR